MGWIRTVESVENRYRALFQDYKKYRNTKNQTEGGPPPKDKDVYRIFEDNLSSNDVRFAGISQAPLELGNILF